MPTQTFATMDVLRLDVETTPTAAVLVNLIQNPDGEYGAWGWLTPVAGSTFTAPVSWNSNTWLVFTPPSPSAPAHFTTEAVSVAAGQWVAAKWIQATPSGDTYSRARVEWLNAAGAVISSSAQGAYWFANVSSASSERTYAAVQAPAGTVRARLRFDEYGNDTTGANPIRPLYIRRPRFFKAATQAAANGTPVSNLPATYTDILGPTSTISFERDELNVGTLTATILDSALDPSQDDLIRTGKRVRLRVRQNGATAYTELFTGKITNGNTKYDLTRPAGAQARITLTAVDPVSQLAQVPAPNGVGTIAELPYVLEGAGVPWNVNGSGNHRASAVVVSTNENAKVLDQVALTRDSALGLAWVDRRGALQAWDMSAIPATLAATLDETAYSDIDVDWDAERCINTVNVKLLRTNAATGETVEVVYGPFIDQASVDRWGPRSRDFTVHGIADTEAAASAYAAQILAANATPTVSINALTLPITAPTDLTLTSGSRRALIDLYDAVRVVNANASIDQVMRPTAVKHTITPDKWMTYLEFARDGGVAPPQQAPPLAGAGGEPGWVPWGIANTEGAGFNTDYVARWTQVGQTVTARFWGSCATTNANVVKINLPVPARNDLGYSEGEHAIGHGMVHVPGVNRYMMTAMAVGMAGTDGAGVSLWFNNTTNSQLTNPGVNTRIGFTVTYETDATP